MRIDFWTLATFSLGCFTMGVSVGMKIMSKAMRK